MKFQTLYKGNLSWAVTNTILWGPAGSRSYGLETATSDYDFKGVCIPPKEHYLGFSHNFEQVEGKVPAANAEYTVYSLQKFFKLCADCNPNIIEFLYLDQYIESTKLGERLIAARDLFLSKKAKFTFSGYAHAQLKKIESHRSWLLNPPKKEPLREDFGLPKDKALVTRDQVGAMEELAIKESELSPNFLAALGKEKAYFQARRHWDQYQNWLQNRNPERAAMEAKFGYDLKHASHLVRLSLMCKEILQQGKVIVKRPDREFLLGIKTGMWTYDQLMDWCSSQETEIEMLYEKSTLQHSPDLVQLNQLCITTIDDFLSC